MLVSFLWYRALLACLKLHRVNFQSAVRPILVGECPVGVEADVQGSRLKLFLLGLGHPLCQLGCWLSDLTRRGRHLSLNNDDAAVTFFSLSYLLAAHSRMRVALDTGTHKCSSPGTELGNLLLTALWTSVGGNARATVLRRPRHAFWVAALCRLHHLRLVCCPAVVLGS